MIPLTGSGDPRAEVVALWRTLATRGAAVTWHDLDALPDDVVDVLRTTEARRIRALAEGDAAGWTPAWRQLATTPAHHR